MLAWVLNTPLLFEDSSNVYFFKRLDKKDKVNLEIHDATAWLTKNYNRHIAQYLTN